MKKRFEFKDNFTLNQLLLIPIGVVINYIGGQLAILLKLPLFLDVIGTILVSILAGPWVGAITGALNNVLIGITQPMAFMSIHVQVIIAITTAFLARKKMLNTVPKFILSSLILIVMTLAGSLPSQIFLLGGVTGSTTDIVTAAVVEAGLPLWLGVVVTQFISNLFDKTSSLLIAFLIVMSMSPRFLSKYRNGDVFMELKKKGKGKERKSKVEESRLNN